MTILNESHKKWLEYRQLQKCGSLSISQNFVMIGLNCDYCSTICTRLDEFGRHIKKEHSTKIAELYAIKIDEDEKISEFEDLFEATAVIKVESQLDEEEDPFAENRILTTPNEFLVKEEGEQLPCSSTKTKVGERLKEYSTEESFDSCLLLNEIKNETEKKSEPIRCRKRKVVEEKTTTIDTDTEDKNSNQDSDYDPKHQSEYSMESEDENEDCAGNQTKIDVFDVLYHDMIIQILEFFKEHTMLWDPQHKEYLRHQKKLKYLNGLRVQLELGFQVDFTVKDLRKIFSKLRSLYYKELEMTKIEKDKTSELWCFDNLKFLPTDRKYGESKKKIAKTALNDIIKCIAKEYINFPILWDINNEGYRNRMQRDAAIMELSQKIELPHSREELRLAISRMRNNYIAEKTKRIQAEKTQQSFEPSNVDLYNQLQFLDAHIGPYCCNYENCTEGLIRHYDKYQSHLAAHEGRKAFACKFCQQDFASYGNLETHIQRKHSGETPFKCSTCNRAFRTTADLKSHQHTHEVAKDFVCCLCGKTYHTNAHLNRHYRRHDTDNYQYQCPHCPKKYCEKYRLREHLNSHMQLREHICGECGKGFFSQHTLHQHQKLHSDVSNYECNICGKRFKQVSAMHSHKKYYHNTLSSLDGPSKALS